MTLAYIEALWGLSLIPALVIFYSLDGQRRRRELEGIGHLPQIRRMIASVSTGRRRFKSVLVVLAIGLIVGALARPQFPGAAHILPRRGLDIVVALDFSRSMLAADVYPSRLERARLELDKLIDGLKGDRVGLIAFAGVTLAYPLTSDYAASKLFWRDLGPSDIPVGGTNLGGAIRESLDLLEHGRPKQSGADTRKAAQVIVLLTDGADTEGGALEAAKEAQKRGVKIYSVGIGSREGDLVPLKKRDDGTAEYITDASGTPMRMELDESTLRQIASMTGGEYFQLDPQRFGVERVQRAIAALERAEEEGRVVREPDEAYLWFLLPAVLLLLLEGMMRERRKPHEAAAHEARSHAERPSAAPTAGPKRPRRRREMSQTASTPSTAAPASSASASSNAAALIVALLLPGLVGWNWFERPSPDVVQGNKQLTAGKAEEALEAYDRALQSRPDDLAIHYNRGAALYTLDKLPEAEREFQRSAESSDPNLRADSFYNTGNLYLKQQKPKEAIDFYKKTLRLRPDDRRAKWNLELALRMLNPDEEKQKQQSQNKDQDKDQNKDQKQDQDKKQDKDQQQDQNKDQDKKSAEDQKKPESESDKQQKGEGKKDDPSQDQKQKDSKNDKPEKKPDGKPDGKKDEKAAPEDKPEQNPKPEATPGQPKKQDGKPEDGKGTPEAAGAARKQIRDIDKQDTEAVLDAFEHVEPTVQKELAKRKAGNRRPKKDW